MLYKGFIDGRKGVGYGLRLLWQTIGGSSIRLNNGSDMCALLRRHIGAVADLIDTLSTIRFGKVHGGLGNICFDRIARFGCRLVVHLGVYRLAVPIAKGANPGQPRKASMRFGTNDIRVVGFSQRVVGAGQHNVSTQIIGEHRKALGTKTYGLGRITVGNARGR